MHLGNAAVCLMLALATSPVSATPQPAGLRPPPSASQSSSSMTDPNDPDPTTTTSDPTDMSKSTTLDPTDVSMPTTPDTTPTATDTSAMTTSPDFLGTRPTLPPADGKNSSAFSPLLGSAPSGLLGLLSAGVTGSGDFDLVPTLGTAPPSAPLTTGTGSPSPSTSEDPKVPKVTPCQKGYGPPQTYGCGKPINSSAIPIVPLKDAKLQPFDSAMFASEEARLGGNTFFSVPQPAPGCKTLIFIESQDMAPRPEVPGILKGVAAHASCLYILTTPRIAVTSCCGNDECSSVGAGISVDAPKIGSRADVVSDQSAGSLSRLRGRTEPGQAPKVVQPGVINTTVLSDGDLPPPPPKGPQAPPGGWAFYPDANVISGSGKYVPPKDPDRWCDVAVKAPSSEDFQRASALQDVGGHLRCDGTLCSFENQFSKTNEGSIDVTGTSESSQTNGITAGGSIQRGFPTIGTITVESSYNHQWASSISNSTGFHNSTSLTTGLTYNDGVLPGVLWHMTIYQAMTCSKFTSKCHTNDTSADIYTVVCSPNFDSTGNPVITLNPVAFT